MHADDTGWLVDWGVGGDVRCEESELAPPPPDAGDLLGISRVTRFTECRSCGRPGEWVDSPTGAWWCHLDHPGDGHDFEPILHYTDERARHDPGWWSDVRPKDRDGLIQVLWRSARPGFPPLEPDDPDWPAYSSRAEQIINAPFGEVSRAVPDHSGAEALSTRPTT
ncbi:hypothetical protein HMPREF1529_02210 [Microbacterium sp. oral taxon 186 str. F0373]|uniref:Uncharacterized protein n=1 Tax=Microbacterium hominis TaxID=162426 RepID=A0A2K9DJ05_9MICO|nr:hypothetical protein [Microbacterium sp. oral taxon 186]AUG29467.1 hypothetical protein CXR34_08315 [Microbacterium hominis]EPD84170.1 hypothetical protein HMPREF1529_02210 [Microbacterium sp. oral taxon 186 str. F0373]